MVAGRQHAGEGESRVFEVTHTGGRPPTWIGLRPARSATRSSGATTSSGPRARVRSERDTRLLKLKWKHDFSCADRLYGGFPVGV